MGVKTDRLRVVSLFSRSLTGLFVAALVRSILCKGEGEVIPDTANLTIGEEKRLAFVASEESMVNEGPGLHSNV